jgi:copper chaperone CopZ
MLKKFGFFLAILMSLQSVSRASSKEVHVLVKGMVCAFCAQGITKKFNALAVVTKVDVSLEKKTVDLSIKDGQSISDDTIQKILTEAGYNVERIERN